MAAAAGADALAVLVNQNEELGLALPTQAELEALNIRLGGLTSRFKVGHGEAVKIRRAMARQSLHLVEWAKFGSPYKAFGSFRVFDVAGIINDAQARGWADTIDAAIMGDPNDKNDTGHPKDEVYKLFFECWTKALKDAEVGPGEYRVRVVIATNIDAKVALKLELKLAKAAEKAEEAAKKQLELIDKMVQVAVDKRVQGLTDKLNQLQNQVNNVNKRPLDEGPNTGNKSRKKMVCLQWVKGSCQHGDDCPEEHKGTMAQLSFLNERFRCGLTKSQIIQKASD